VPGLGVDGVELHGRAQRLGKLLGLCRVDACGDQALDHW
jgi:hypothetical protein